MSFLDVGLFCLGIAVVITGTIYTIHTMLNSKEGFSCARGHRVRTYYVLGDSLFMVALGLVIIALVALG
jgi:uncharacterized membrane protein YidH (DUF202 family)